MHVYKICTILYSTVTVYKTGYSCTVKLIAVQYSIGVQVISHLTGGGGGRGQDRLRPRGPRLGVQQRQVRDRQED